MPLPLPHPHGAASLLVLGALLSGCAGSTGPVIGDWRGYQSTRVSYYYAEIEIILDGSPGSSSGIYRYARTSRENFGDGAGRFLRWTDHWTVRPVVVGGRHLLMVHLARLPNGDFEDYVALPDGALVPVADPARPDLSTEAMRFALSPLPRTAYGYGRP